MPQAYVDPEELERFARNLKQFNDELQNSTARLQGQFAKLGDVWRDQEHARFAHEFQQTLGKLRSFMLTADTLTPFLLRKAQKAREYFSGMSGTGTLPTGSSLPKASNYVSPAYGFRNKSKLSYHFKKHKDDFKHSFTDEQEYEQAATKFLVEDLLGGVLQKVRPNGDIVRFNPTTDEYGVLTSRGVIRTYYILELSEHEFSTNLAYFYSR